MIYNRSEIETVVRDALIERGESFTHVLDVRLSVPEIVNMDTAVMMIHIIVFNGVRTQSHDVGVSLSVVYSDPKVI